ncbi:hypothetical protein RYZ26_19585 [Terasakiella sp. A23]|uniref:hypothetical protein n=1 Tax=Terasakiella sp. FCG-A23 TaxID=3080561 RepID=UPI002954130A|nr:hypothetical protein [Terasakiella sp. A23]MDV7341807.1 hypothetical protein [Terasakiella sp. A23]
MSATNAYEGEGNSVIYEYSDGSKEEWSGGTRAWRNNNPGNIRAGGYVNGRGAIGSAGGFGVFPDYDTGYDALTTLIGSRNYRNKTLGQAISRYAPSSENDTDSYISHVEEATGYDRDTPMQNIIDNGDLSSVADAIEDHEGYSEGGVNEIDDDEDESDAESQNADDEEKPETEEPSEAAKEVSEATADTSNDFLFKSVEDLTEGEVKDLMVKRNNSQNDKPLFDELVAKERKWFSTRYGDDPVKFDETGKMIQPVAKNPAPKEPKPLTIPGGQTMANAIKAVTAQLNKSSDNKVDAIRGLQTGINRTKQKTEVPLKVDGMFGPKSANDLKKAIAALGPTKVGEANALGQFQHKADKAKKSGDANNLIADATTTFEPLLPSKKGQKENPLGLALQTAINETNKDDDQIPQLKEDGIIGPITEDVFGMTVKKKDTEDLTDNFGYFLGFA